MYPDYVTDLNTSQELHILDDLLASTGITDWMTEEQRETFRQGGYYSVNLTPNVTLITLNTIIYTSSFLNANDLTTDTLGEDPLG